MKARNREQFVQVWRSHVMELGSLFLAANTADLYEENRNWLFELIEQAADRDFPDEARRLPDRLPATADQLLALINRERDARNETSPRGAAALTHILDRATAHKLINRSIGPGGD